MADQLISKLKNEIAKVNKADDLRINNIKDKAS